MVKLAKEENVYSCNGVGRWPLGNEEKKMPKNQSDKRKKSPHPFNSQVKKFMKDPSLIIKGGLPVILNGEKHFNLRIFGKNVPRTFLLDCLIQ